MQFQSDAGPTPALNDPDSEQSQPEPDSSSRSSMPGSRSRWQSPLVWVSIPLLAFAAYLSVLWIGFLSDDLILLNVAKTYGLDASALLPNQTWPFYRPVGVIGTWQLGWQLWGYNPLPFHLLGLLLHAATSLLLGLWLAEITSRRLLGWLAGALFAVFPIHVEAVGWVAAQWDLWAALFGFAGLWLFTKWWKVRGSWYIYALSLASFFLGVFSKESLFTFLPIFPLSIWLLNGRLGRSQWRTMLISLVPFGAVILLNIGLRIAFNGSLGYPTARTDFGDFYWDSLVTYLGMLIAPINAVFAGKLTEQIVATLISFALLAGLIIYGRRQWKLLLMGGLWIVLAIVPVLNLAQNNDDLTDSRFLYLASAGYAIVLAALLFPLISWLGTRWRMLEGAVIIVPLLAGITLAWINLQPWHIATAQVERINNELFRLIPPEKRPQGMVWYVQNNPDNYAGAYIFRLGLGNIRYFTSPTVDTPAQEIQNIAGISLNQDSRDAFAMRFAFDPSQESYYVDYMSGRTAAEPASLATDGLSDLHVWDFTACPADITAGWQLRQATATCDKSTGLIVTPQSADPQLISPPLSFGQDIGKAGEGQFLRVRVSIRYPQGMPTDRFLSQWYWGASAGNFNATNQMALLINHTKNEQVYWTYIPVAGLSTNKLTLRFDPINSTISEQIHWIAVDVVK